MLHSFHVKTRNWPRDSSLTTPASFSLPSMIENCCAKLSVAISENALKVLSSS